MFWTFNHNGKLLIGKLAEVNPEDELQDIEVFFSPEKIEKFTVSMPDLKTYEPIGHTAFWFDEKVGSWFSGRIFRVDHRLVYVSPDYLRNDPENLSSFDSDDIYVRACDATCETESFIKNGLFSYSKDFVNKYKFLKCFYDQQEKVNGLSALPSSSIKLLEFQVRTVETILSDPLQRYLLADEPGLGKTIQAGLIIRQHIIETEGDGLFPDTFVIVPNNLKKQWEDELQYKFHLGNYFKRRIVVLDIGTVSQSNIDEMKKNVKLLVIDEVQLLTSSDDMQVQKNYEVCLSLSKVTRKLLLISATPSTRDELGIYRTLCLLNADVMDQNQKELMLSKIRMRDKIGEIYENLDENDVDNVYLVTDELEQSLNVFSRDKKYCEMVQDILFNEPSKKKILNLKQYIGEVYRLSNRIIRQNRKSIDLEGEKFGRTGLTKIELESLDYERVEQLLEDWRIEVFDKSTESENKQLYKNIIDNLFIDILECRKYIQDALKSQKNEQYNDFFSQKSIAFLSNIYELLNEKIWVKKRCEKLVEYISAREKNFSIVVFCNNQFIAMEIDSFLQENCEEEVIYTQNPGADILNKYSVIILDNKGEIGLNLQIGNKILVHFDLPINPNRLEQRLGRFDRIGATHPIASILFFETYSYLQKSILHLFESTYSVFNDSIASLQYLVSELENERATRMFKEGFEYFTNISNELTGTNGLMAKELKQLEKGAKLEQLNLRFDDLNLIDFEKLKGADDFWIKVSNDLIPWVLFSLPFTKLEKDSFGSFSAVKSKSTFDYSKQQNPFKLRFDQHANLSQFEYDYFLDTNLDNEIFVIERQSGSEEKQSKVFRYGNEVLNGIKKFTEFTELGQSFIIWRKVMDYQRYFSTDKHNMRAWKKLRYFVGFLTFIDIQEVITVLKKKDFNGSLPEKENLIRLLTRIFPTKIQTKWFDTNIKPCSESEEGFLTKSVFSKNREKAFARAYFDEPVHVSPGFCSRNKALMNQIKESAKDVIKTAEQSILEKEKDRLVETGMKNAKNFFEKRINTLRSQIMVTFSETDKTVKQNALDNEMLLERVVLEQIRNYEMKNIFFGVVVLTSENLKVGEV